MSANNQRVVTTDWLKQLHRDLDACQKVIWLGLDGADPSYCRDAQARLREIDLILAAAPRPAFQYSTDHDALWDFICAGHAALCFVDYRFFGDDPKDCKPWRDPAAVRRRGPNQIDICARGISYGNVYPFEAGRWPDEKELFLKACSNINLEWASPQQPAPRPEAGKQSCAECGPVDDGTALYCVQCIDKMQEQPAPIPTTIPISERLPTTLDADFMGHIWALGKLSNQWHWVHFSTFKFSDFVCWQPTGLTRPADPDQSGDKPE